MRKTNEQSKVVWDNVVNVHKAKMGHKTISKEFANCWCSYSPMEERQYNCQPSSEWALCKISSSVTSVIIRTEKNNSKTHERSLLMISKQLGLCYHWLHIRWSWSEIQQYSQSTNTQESQCEAHLNFANNLLNDF